MQFHHNGYVSEDPRVLPAEGYGVDRETELPDEMDVLIVGSGPAGMIAAAQLSMFPNVNTRIIERRPHRLELGQADGIQSRSVETFQAFGFATEITDEAYEIVEMSFWNKDPENPDNIVRGARPLDDEFGISEFPHLIVNQARVLDYFARFAQQGPARITPDFGWSFIGLEVEDEGEYPVAVTVEDTDGNQRVIHAKYVVGCDGAHSAVRKSIGRKMAGDKANHAWGVADVVVETDFPDWRTKAAIHSKAGSALHIPREGGYLSRMYIDLGEVPEDDNHNVRKTSVETVIKKANEIYAPYKIDVKEVAWHSVYEVGHRLVDAFHDVDDTPRVFLTGDACHTHSAKAGQGMNVSIQDGFNIAWKLGHVLDGRAPEELLCTYHGERQPAAQNLINFDREWSTLMATPVEELEDPEAVEKYYVDAEEFAAGMLTEYAPNLIVAENKHQDLATGFPVGKRFKSHVATRRADARTLHLGHEHFADGRYRIYVFADPTAPTPEDQSSPVVRWSDAVRETIAKYTPADADENALFDIKVIYQQHHHTYEHGDAPRIFRPLNGKYQITNWENVWNTAQDNDIYEARGISRDGAVVIVRPDQYVGAVLPLDKPELVDEYFANNLIAR
ncbi:FAD-dependent monooxygenase [Corynebacterium ammoniagenes]|jgi:phenol 2-monooxygenase|uniref:Phenol 2-monooxygenase n=2 Tax=Corynebacterium ammoniagenes TaxID=1697 RepID=A0AAV5G8K7_CORAM|nr:FAD-dependent monooxygenase [Corynebacterium ammoniagenes]APT83690.1 phenol 2-monooxygenase [Corynebacterium ammoniagenes DSM 20306]AQS72488.1 phenol 2-monooxygenase [Corynebacterium ammoniagenes]EFG81694.1 FAD binding domain protein [Corynebacterium ammoniagenes DSM 20306]NMF32744.1 3-hydroxybenzoate 4-monooxygenase [Corynebacterium ammoniagenes]GJN43386.1 phenol 2-monooxygenase [Corynebacterium ammoniagenes]